MAGLGPPRLVLITGPAATGKSTLADAAANLLGCAVFSWDWAMAALTPFPSIGNALRRMERVEYRQVGWGIVYQLATAELRRGRSAVLDGVAYTDQIPRTRRVASEHGATSVVVATKCDDPQLHRQRVEGRQRGIPGWHELDWAHVASVRNRWELPADVDLVLEAGESLEQNLRALRAAVGAPAS